MRRDRSTFRYSRRDRGDFRLAIAIEISLALHLLLILIGPRLYHAWPDKEEAVARLIPLQQMQEQQSKPLQFELVDLAEEREEEPVAPDVPLSDLDRRAHGGEGAASRRPASQGNTFQLVQNPGGEQSFRIPPQPQVQPVPPPEQEQPQRREERQPTEDEQEQELRLDGAGEGEEQPLQILPEPRTWASPPQLGGLLENPDRTGGEVDSGALSFDTQWYDWGPYAKVMLNKIRRNWNIPNIARMGVSGVVKIRFYIERDGTVVGLRILDESGRPPMDFAARDAIATSSPFAPLPADLTGVEREGVTITFYYNRRPPDRGGY